MLKMEISAAQGGAASTNTNTWARTCDTCHSAASAVYCRADVAYLCTGCDARVHAANQVASRHERVWVCEACERAPAAFVCKADSASLCSACDADIHSANPLARRHHRVPILPISGTHYSPSPANPGGLIFGPSGDEEYEDEATSWLLFNPIKNGDDYGQRNDDDDDDNGPLFGGEVDKYLDLDEYNSCQNNQFSDGYYCHQQHQTVPDDQKRCGGDGVVPIQFQKGKDHHCFQLGGMEFEASNAGYGYPASMSQSASLSSMEVGVVPESRASEISVSHTRPPKGTIDLFSGPPVQIPTQLSAVDREARVLRYREKKKNRKFEKTIRYASRKAYAETRPRIKGRFAKRTDVEVRVEQMFSASSFIAAEGAYGVVPSF